MDEKLKLKNRLYLILTIFLFLFSSQGYGSECKSLDLMTSRFINYSKSDFIGVCKIVNGNRLEIIEHYKEGFNLDNEVYYFSDLDLKEGELWLIYANKVKIGNDYKLQIDECSLSRSFSNPLRLILNVNEYELPEITKNTKQFESSIKLLKIRAAQDLNSEIVWLQTKKVFEIENNSNSEKKESISNKLILIILLLMSLIQIPIFIYYANKSKLNKSD